MYVPVSLLKASRDALLLLGPDDRVVDANAAAQRLFALDAAALRSRRLHSLVPAAQHARLDGLLERCREHAQASGELALGRAAAGCRMRASLARVTEGDGDRAEIALLIAAAAAQPPADRREAELAGMCRMQELSTRLLHEHTLDDLLEETLAAAIELTGADMGNLRLLDADSGEMRIRAQRGFRQPFIEALETVNTRHRCCCSAALRRGERVVIGDVADSGDFYEDGLRAAMLGAGVRSVQATPLVSRRGEILGMISTHWRRPHGAQEQELRLLDVLARQAADLAERMRDQQSLRESEARARSAYDLLKCIIEGTDDLVAALDTELRFTAVNTAYQETFHQMYGSEVTVGMHLPDALAHRPEAQAQVIALWRRALGGEAVHETEAFGDGRERRVFDLRFSPIRDYQGHIIGAREIGSDVTERVRVATALRRANAGLLEADRRKDEFLAVLAHELRNPLAPIRNSLGILRLGARDAAVAERVHAMMDRQVTHLVRLVDDLLEVSRITRGKIELRRERVELARVVHSAVEVSGPLIDAARQQLSIQLPPEPLFLEADPVRLAQVLGNLLNNASRYTGEGGRIWLSVGRRGAQATISVRDNGAGIDPALLPQVFDMFAQGARGRGSRGGLGIGLTLVRGLVELHGGSIEASSAGPGRGSEFLVRLPLAAAAEPPGTDAPVRAVQPELAVRRVLVVDDNHDAADSLAVLLQLLGAEAEVVYDGAAALHALERYRPAAILLDIGMPGIDGYEVAQRIRRDPRHAQVMLVAMTGWGQDGDRQRARDAGFDHHMTKPVELDALRGLLGRTARSRVAVSPE